MPLSEEDLELLKGSLNNIRVPGSYDKVFKDEDIFSFDRQAWVEWMMRDGLGTCLGCCNVAFIRIVCCY